MITFIMPKNNRMRMFLFVKLSDMVQRKHENICSICFCLKYCKANTSAGLTSCFVRAINEKLC